MPLHDMPQTFSCMHAWQIPNPQRHCQQNGTSRLQQWQVVTLMIRLFFLRAAFVETFTMCVLAFLPLNAIC
jgi:hypothetical protein